MCVARAIESGYTFAVTTPSVAQIGARVLNLRKGLGMTQCELADALGVRQPTISEIERGDRTELDYAMLDRLATALGVTLMSLVAPVDIARAAK